MTERVLVRDLLPGDVVVIANETVTVLRLDRDMLGFVTITFRSRQFPNGGGVSMSGRQHVVLIDRPTDISDEHPKRPKRRKRNLDEGE